MDAVQNTTGFRIERFPFKQAEVSRWGATDSRHRNWPVVYVLSSESDVYVGESINAEGRIRQHLSSRQKKHLNGVRVILDNTFNKSACLDLESFLIRMFSGDGQLQVLNSNAGITDADYYDRQTYTETFNNIFEALRTQEQLFQRTLPEIINSDLFKLSPFKALNHDQAIAVEDIIEGLFDDLDSGEPSTIVIQGGPGTGKTVVAIYILKLLEDIRAHDPEEPLDSDSIFSEFFTSDNAEILRALKVGLVVPQQSLRESIARVFRLTPGLHKDQVLTPFAVGESDNTYDILIVDEAHRLNQRANQPSGQLNKKFSEINSKIFGFDDLRKTQLDWLLQKSKHTIFMLDSEQSVRPADLSASVTSILVEKASSSGRLYPLRSQMRVNAGQDYVGYVRAVLGDTPPSSRLTFPGYDLRLFDNLGDMRHAIEAHNGSHGLSRLVAGYAWPWKSKTNSTEFDIEVDGEQLRWNSTQRDWISSPKAVQEVGSIHTVQGYDLNYAGVIIGKDLQFDVDRGRTQFSRSHYFDKKGMENNPKLGLTYSDDDLLSYVRNIYAVLMTRGILGTYIYACDEALRFHLKSLF